MTRSTNFSDCHCLFNHNKYNSRFSKVNGWKIIMWLRLIMKAQNMWYVDRLTN